MPTRRLALVLGLTLGVGTTSTSAAQPPKGDTAALPPFYTQLTPLAVTFTANLGRLRADKDTNAPWRAASLA